MRHVPVLEPLAGFSQPPSLPFSPLSALRGDYHEPLGIRRGPQ